MAEQKPVEHHVRSLPVAPDGPIQRVTLMKEERPEHPLHGVALPSFPGSDAMHALEPFRGALVRSYENTDQTNRKGEQMSAASISDSNRSSSGGASDSNTARIRSSACERSLSYALIEIGAPIFAVLATNPICLCSVYSNNFE